MNDIADSATYSPTWKAISSLIKECGSLVCDFLDDAEKEKVLLMISDYTDRGNTDLVESILLILRSAKSKLLILQSMKMFRSMSYYLWSNASYVPSQLAIDEHTAKLFEDLDIRMQSLYFFAQYINRCKLSSASADTILEKLLENSKVDSVYDNYPNWRENILTAIAKLVKTHYHELLDLPQKIVDIKNCFIDLIPKLRYNQDRHLTEFQEFLAMISTVDDSNGTVLIPQFMYDIIDFICQMMQLSSVFEEKCYDMLAELVKIPWFLSKTTIQTCLTICIGTIDALPTPEIRTSCLHILHACLTQHKQYFSPSRSLELGRVMFHGLEYEPNYHTVFLQVLKECFDFPCYQEKYNNLIIEWLVTSYNTREDLEHYVIEVIETVVEKMGYIRKCDRALAGAWFFTLYTKAATPAPPALDHKSDHTAYPLDYKYILRVMKLVGRVFECIVHDSDTTEVDIPALFLSARDSQILQKMLSPPVENMAEGQQDLREELVHESLSVIQRMLRTGGHDFTAEEEAQIINRAMEMTAVATSANTRCTVYAILLEYLVQERLEAAQFEEIVETLRADADNDVGDMAQCCYATFAFALALYDDGKYAAMSEACLSKVMAYLIRGLKHSESCVRLYCCDGLTRVFSSEKEVLRRLASADDAHVDTLLPLLKLSVLQTDFPSVCSLLASIFRDGRWQFSDTVVDELVESLSDAYMAVCNGGLSVNLNQEWCLSHVVDALAARELIQRRHASSLLPWVVGAEVMHLDGKTWHVLLKRLWEHIVKEQQDLRVEWRDKSIVQMFFSQLAAVFGKINEEQVYTPPAPAAVQGEENSNGVVAVVNGVEEISLVGAAGGSCASEAGDAENVGEARGNLEKPPAPLSEEERADAVAIQSYAIQLSTHFIYHYNSYLLPFQRYDLFEQLIRVLCEKRFNHPCHGLARQELEKVLEHPQLLQRTYWKKITEALKL